MSSVATAIVGGAIIGGIASKGAADSAAGAQNAATQAQSTAAANELAWAKEQQAAWDQTFGPTQDILAEYYNTLDPQVEANKQIMTGVQEMQKGYQDYQVKLDQTLAQRGLDQSGLSAELTSQAMYQNEMQKAGFRADVLNSAEANVAGQKAGFLQLGLGQAGGIQQNIAGAYSGQTNVLGQQATAATAANTRAQANFASSVGTIGSSLGYAAGGGFTQPAVDPLYGSSPSSSYTQYPGGATWG